MKKNKIIKVAVLFVVFILLLAVYFILKNNNKEAEEQAEETADTTEIFSVSADEITGIKFKISDEEASFTKEDETWSLEGDPDFPVDSEQMTVLTDALFEVKATRTLEDEDIEDLEEYGLKEPQNIITITKLDGDTVVIYVGDTNGSTGDCYIYLNDQKEKVYTVDADLATVFAGSMLNYAEETAFPTIVGTDISDIQVEKTEDSYHLQSDETSSTGWTVASDGKTVKEADATKLESIQSGIAGFTYANYYEYNCKDMSKYGLDNPYATISIKYTEVLATETDEEDSEDSVEEEKELKIFIGNEDEMGNRYIRIDDSTEVHAISSDSLTVVLNSKPTDYENTMVTSVLMDDLESMDVTVDGKTHILRSETKDDEMLYYLDDIEMEAMDYMTFYSKATALNYQSKLEKGKEVSGEAELVIVFNLKDGNTEEVKFIPYDSNFYVAVLSKNEETLLVNKIKVKELIEEAKGF